MNNKSYRSVLKIILFRQTKICNRHWQLRHKFTDLSFILYKPTLSWDLELMFIWYTIWKLHHNLKTSISELKAWYRWNIGTFWVQHRLWPFRYPNLWAIYTIQILVKIYSSSSRLRIVNLTMMCLAAYYFLINIRIHFDVDRRSYMPWNHCQTKIRILWTRTELISILKWNHAVGAIILHNFLINLTQNENSSTQ